MKKLLCCLLLCLPATARAANYEVETVKDLAYYEGDGADDAKHKLDLYLPKGGKDVPVLFFVHGGGWISGDRNYFGVYSSLGKCFARHGIAAVVISYRLSPKVKHPEHVKDVARAFAWTYRNIAKYGGRTDQIFACGHSAGGHLVALLATDETYLKAEGLTAAALRGVMPISGVYKLPARAMANIFGDDDAARRQAEPLSHAHENLPPFLVLWAETDLAPCGKGPSELFCQALKDKKNSVETCELKGRNHLSIIAQASRDEDPAAVALREFITRQCKAPAAGPRP